ncbi:MAG: cytochrome b5-like heme/steroid binding domain-containing protein [Wenzhouxiangellaceae bacterium]
MKKLTYTAFVAFWASIATLLSTNQLVSASHDEAQALPAVTLAQVAEHATEQDCWMAIEGKVYDLTDYLPYHPTPAAVILPWCGTEATKGMRTKGYGRDHSPAAWAELEEYVVGTLAEE